MPNYLEEAAALLRKAAEKNERENSAQYAGTHLIEGRERIAMKFAQLAAIEQGVFPVELAAVLLGQARAEASR